MKSKQDYYEALGTTPSANAEEITKAYRKIALKYHPDKNRENPESNIKMQKINEVYAILSDPKKRRDYDVQQGYGSLVTKFRKGSKVRVNANSNSPYRNHTGLVDKEPLKDNFRFWYVVKFDSKALAGVSRFAEEELEEVSE
jgi:DnaJ-class molecular chaperone